MWKNCPKCSALFTLGAGGAVPDSAVRFCGWCGAPLEEYQSWAAGARPTPGDAARSATRRSAFVQQRSPEWWASGVAGELGRLVAQAHAAGNRAVSQTEAEDFARGWVWLHVYDRKLAHALWGKDIKKPRRAGAPYKMILSMGDLALNQREAYADAFAKVLRNHGYDIYTSTALD